MRFNLGARAFDSGATIRATLRDQAGNVLTTVTRTFAPNSLQQSDAASFLGGVAPGPSDTITIDVTEGSLLIYGVTADNRTGDPAISIGRRTTWGSRARENREPESGAGVLLCKEGIVMNLPRLAAIGSILLLASGAARAAAGGRYDLSVVVDGTAAAEYPFQSKTYIEAIRGRSFTLRISNPTSERVAVALSVDGRNVIDAKRTSAGAATKWVLGPGQILEVPGWQVSGQTARRFFFTDTGHSYAKWLGDTANVGTIEAFFYRERARRLEAWTPPREPEPLREDNRSGAADGLAEETPQMQGEAKSRDSAQAAPEAGASGSRREMMQPRPTEADRFAATGIGERTSNPIEWVDFEAESAPAARISLRYEFRPELVRLGVLPRADDLFARERGRGFEPEYAPDPGRIH